MTLSTALAPLDDFPAFKPMAGKAMLTRRQKAAVLVRALMSEGARLSLTSLPEELQTELALAMSEIDTLEDDTVRTVIEDFGIELDRKSRGGAGGVAGALALLEGAISPAAIRKLRNQFGITAQEDPWERVLACEPEQLLPIFEKESIEAASVVLSKLKISTAAALLGLLPGDRARRITYAISLTSGIGPQAVRKIGEGLQGYFEVAQERAFADSPVERVGAILNFSRSSTRDDMLEGLTETDPAFAEDVRRSIFTFANIPARIDPRDIPKIIRQVEQDQLVMALSYAPPELHVARDFILGAMSQRMADGLRTEIAEGPEVKEAEGEAAMTAIIAVIRSMEEAGEIYLVANDEPEEA